MTIYGTFGKFYRRNEKTGESFFSVFSDGKKIMCSGISLHYTSYHPLKLEGEYDTHDIFLFTSVSSYSCSITVAKEFLTSKTFTGIGDAVATNIVDKLGTNIFGNIAEDTDLDTLTASISQSEAVRKCVRKLYAFRMQELIYEYLLSVGGRYQEVSGVFSAYGNAAIKTIKTSPYCLLALGADITVCEKIAAQNNVEMSNKTRVNAIVKNSLFKNHDNGNTKIDFGKLCEIIHRTEERSGAGYHTSPLFVAEAITSDDFVIEYNEQSTDVYLATDYNDEDEIASNLLRLHTSITALEFQSESIDELEKRFSVEYSEDQKAAFDTIKTSGVKIITGGPGTGKTTLLNGLLTKYQENNIGKEIVLCAPTGCAARRMQESTGRPAVTLHKLLKIRPFKMNIYTKEELTADCIVVDEGSMIDTFMMAQLLGSVKNGALVILLGDENQLPSVSAGNVLHDLIESGEIPVYRLTTIFRQAEENLIVANSKKIISGDTNLSADKRFKIMRFKSEEDLIAKAVELSDSCYKRGFINTKLYTPTKKPKFMTGTIQMNRLLQKCRVAENATTVDYGYYQLSVGDSVMFTKNNYDKGYYNGEEGEITCIQIHSGTCYVTVKTEDESLTLSGSEIEDIELAYAITAHKSQGAECDNAIIIVPKAPTSMLKRQLLYVEVTRAKKNVIILSEDDAIDLCIRDFMEIKRNTGLKEKIQRRKEVQYGTDIPATGAVK